MESIVESVESVVESVVEVVDPIDSDAPILDVPISLKSCTSDSGRYRDNIKRKKRRQMKLAIDNAHKHKRGSGQAKRVVRRSWKKKGW